MRGSLKVNNSNESGLVPKCSKRLAPRAWVSEATLVVPFCWKKHFQEGVFCISYNPALLSAGLDSHFLGDIGHQHFVIFKMKATLYLFLEAQFMHLIKTYIL